ncbi:MAG: hypothetical protein ABL958_09830 [Bdellovibrionia bacterium]
MIKWVLLPVCLGLLSCGGEGNGVNNLPPLVSLRATAFGSGTLSIEGTVDLPDASAEGANIRLFIKRTNGSADQEKTGTVTTLSHEVRYSISGLPAGDYQIELQVDQTGNSLYSESGDIEGWYNGSLNSPIQNSTVATTIVLASVSRTNINFGAGLIP